VVRARVVPNARKDMQTIIHSVLPIHQHVNAVLSAAAPCAGRAATAAEIKAAQAEIESWADEKTWSRAQRAAALDRYDAEGERDPVMCVWAELARVTCRGPAPTVRAITEALLVLPGYEAPPPPAEDQLDDDDAMSQPPTLVERLDHMLGLSTSDPISRRRIRCICAAMAEVLS
jgi:hypothetical protein